MIDRKKAVGLWRILAEVGRVRHYRLQYLVTLDVLNHILGHSFISEALQKGVLERLEERYGTRINYDLIDVVDVDRTSDIQTPCLS